MPLGDYAVNFEVRRNRRNPAQVSAPGYALVLAAGPDEYVVAGNDIQVTFAPRLLWAIRSCSLRTDVR